MATPMAMIPLCVAPEEWTKLYLERSMHQPVEVMAWLPSTAGARAPYEPHKPEALPRKARAPVASPALRYETVRVVLQDRRRAAAPRELKNLAKDRGLVDFLGSHFGPPVGQKRTAAACYSTPTKKHARDDVRTSPATVAPKHLCRAATLPDVGDPSGTRDRSDVPMSDEEVLDDDRWTPVWPCMFDDDA